ncbi:MAG TPA: hypothetical protein DCX14_00300 [Flavobacteriales bacterium]|jgi:hypothetical protein|nr:hypothetical protein [Flavobacteriales bacterium]HAW18598.1 hypothetical protein [Flavobacteriales bacterium]
MSHPINYYLSLAALSLLFVSGALHAQNALQFDGANDYVQTTFDGVLGSTNRTFEAWVNLSSSATGNNAVIDYGQNAVGSRNTFMINSNNGLSFISGGTNANIGTASNIVTANQWTHVAFVLDSGTGYLYLNGTQVGTGSLTSVNTPTTGTDLRIGQRVSGGNIPFEGAIDEVRVWDYARTAAEISANMGAEFCELDSHLVAYHKFNHGIASGTNTGVNSSYDASGNGNNGTLTNMALSGSTSNWVTGAGVTVSALSSAINATGCGGTYTSPSGNYTWTTAGTYADTIQSVMACDSILTITLTFSTSTSASITESACASYTSPSGAYTWTESGTYADTIVNSTGCDSIMTIDLSINNSTSEFTVEACDSYTLPSGNQTGPFSGTYLDTISNAAGCDSFMIIHVGILYSTSSFITELGCNSYTSPSGLIWTESGTYIDTIAAANGCDSVITIDLTLDTVNNGISKSGKTLTATANGASYQWIDCSDSSLVIGATSEDYSPEKTGEYAVIVTQNGCTDTSECLNVKIVGVQQFDSSIGASLYPNPTSGAVTIDLGKRYDHVWVRIMNAEGKIVRSVDGLSRRKTLLDLGQGTGLFTIYVYTEDGYQAFRVIKVE